MSRFWTILRIPLIQIPLRMFGDGWQENFTRMKGLFEFKCSFQYLATVSSYCMLKLYLQPGYDLSLQCEIYQSTEFGGKCVNLSIIKVWPLLAKNLFVILKYYMWLQRSY